MWMRDHWASFPSEAAADLLRSRADGVVGNLETVLHETLPLDPLWLAQASRLPLVPPLFLACAAAAGLFLLCCAVLTEGRAVRGRRAGFRTWSPTRRPSLFWAPSAADRPRTDPPCPPPLRSPPSLRRWRRPTTTASTLGRKGTPSKLRPPLRPSYFAFPLRSPALALLAGQFRRPHHRCQPRLAPAAARPPAATRLPLPP